MSEAPKTGGDGGFRQDLTDILASDRVLEAKLEAVFDLGREYLGVENVHLTRIHTETDHWECIVSTDEQDGRFPAGLTLDLGDTYCRRTLDTEGSVALHDAQAQGWDGDPALQAHGLSCYHGTTVKLNGEPYGTLCFVADQARPEPFTERETLFAELLGKIAEQQLERDRHETDLHRRAQLNSVFSRVLRHNIRNELTVIRGRVTQIEGTAGETASHTESVLTATDSLIEISNKSRTLERIISTEFTRTETDLSTLLAGVVDDVRQRYPAATITVEGADVTIPVMASLEQALLEVVENAAKHTGPEPRVTVAIDPADTSVAITVSDSGPGLPTQEQQVLDTGVETPLAHGSGLGLWTAHWVVSSHSGTIETAVSGEGTRLTISLPRDVSDPFPRATVPPVQQGDDRYQAAFEGAFDAMVLLREDTVVDANAAAGDLFGRDTGDLLGQQVGDVFDDGVDLAPSTGPVETRQRDTTRLTRADGSERIVEYTVSSPLDNGQTLVVAHDVTEREARSSALTRSRALFERAQTIDGVSGWEIDPNPIVVVDRDGAVQKWNTAAEETFGWTAAEVTGHPLPTVPAASRERYQYRLGQVLKGTSYTEIASDCLTRPGELLGVSISMVPVRDTDDVVSGAMIVYTQLTDRPDSLADRGQGPGTRSSAVSLSTAALSSPTTGLDDAAEELRETPVTDSGDEESR